MIDAHRRLQEVAEQELPEDSAEELGMKAVAVRKAKSRVTSRLRQELGDLIA